MKKVSIKSQVAANIETLRGMNHGELFKWSRENGLDSSAGFSGFKKALLEHGIDYAAMRENHREAKAEALSSACTHEVTLYSDAKASCDRFAICDGEGEPVWYGRFFQDDNGGYNGEQSSGELSAALKAVWLASKIKEAAGLSALRLTLKVDADWLRFTTGKPKILHDTATKFNLDLKVVHIPGKVNPADSYTTCQGFKKWNEEPLAHFPTPITAEVAE